MSPETCGIAVAVADDGIRSALLNQRLPEFRGQLGEELVARCQVHVEAYYRRADGAPTSEADKTAGETTLALIRAAYRVTGGVLSNPGLPALWAIERRAGCELFSHPAIKMVADTAPIELRKVRILNGAHTAMVIKAMPLGIETVREAIEDPRVGPWLQCLLLEEIVPPIADRVPDAEAFVASTFERFANPFLEPRLQSIALNHTAKIEARLLPTQEEYAARFSRRPRLLDELLEQACSGYAVSV